MIVQNGVGITTLLNGETVKQTLNPANETVGRGIYAATTLSAVDAELASANIKNGITIFGFAGDADVHDISDATAVEAEVITGETFYAVGGGIRTGTMPIVAIIAANDNYPAGYHVGDAGGLDAIDVDLATANIKFGITIFGKAGHVDVRDVSDANALVGEVMNGRTFYAVGGARKTGTLATVTLNPAANAYPAGYHVGDASLTAVDGDLVAGNIADGVTIFGVLGTFVGGALVEDITGYAGTPDIGTTAGTYQRQDSLGTGVNLTFGTKALTFAAGSRAVAVGWTNSDCAGSQMKLQLIMGGVQVAESAFIDTSENWIVVGTRALVGLQTCLVRVHNYHVDTKIVYRAGRGNGDVVASGIGVGSIKT